MESFPYWQGIVLKKNAYFSKKFDEDLTYDHSTRDDFLKEINERESIKMNEILNRKSKLKPFFSVLDTRNSVTSRLKTLKEESVFQPDRNYWYSYKDYITYSVCPFVMQFELYTVMKRLMSKDSGFLCLTAFIITKIFFNWIMTYLMIALGAYHKQGIFYIRYLLPIAKYFPYVTTGMLVWNMSSRIDLYSEILLYFILYLLAEIYIIDLKFSGCKEVMPFPEGVKCYSPVERYQVEHHDCSTVELQEFIFQCPDQSKYLMPEQVILQYMHYDAKYIFLRNLSMCLLFFVLLFASGRVHKLLKIIRLAMLLRLGLYILMILISRDLFVSGILSKLDPSGALSIKSFFSSDNVHGDVFMGCISAFRDLPSLIFVQWGGTSRLAGSTKPVRDSVLITLIDIVISLVEIMLLLMVYLVSMDQTMLWISPIIGFRTRRIPLVPIYIFVKTYSNNAEITMIVVLMIFTITHLNALICEFESLKFSISLINQDTYLNANIISFGLVPIFYTFSLICQIIESNVSSPLPVSVVLTTSFSVSSLIIFTTIFFIYSYSRFQRDVTFMTGNKPGVLVKVLLVGPIVFTIVMIVLSFNSKNGLLDLVVFIGCLVLILGLSVTYVIYKFATYSRKDFKSLFFPSFFYGPPNHDLRKERKRFRHSTI